MKTNMKSDETIGLENPWTGNVASDKNLTWRQIVKWANDHIHPIGRDEWIKVARRAARNEQGDLTMKNYITMPNGDEIEATAENSKMTHNVGDEVLFCAPGYSKNLRGVILSVYVANPKSFVAGTVGHYNIKTWDASDGSTSRILPVLPQQIID